MKQVHSTKWKSSVQPRKQRKYLHNLPDHLVGTQLQVHLSKPLREKHGIRAVRVRKGDKVKVLRGTHKGKEGKVERVDTMNRRVIVAKIEVDKKQGGTAPYPLQPSNLMITEVMSDKRRFKKTTAKVAKPAPAETKSE